MIRTAAILGLALVVSACEREAGRELNRKGTFGEATLNNTAVMSGERDYAIQLAGRFAKEVPTTINFDFDSARLDGQARTILDQQAHWIKQFPEVRFRVFGHTDAVGSSGYNKSLGLRRAQTAVNYLVSRGISRGRLQAMVSHGETQPLIPTPDRERRNRRTVTEVSGFLKRHPSVLDGKYAQIIYREYLESAIPGTTLTEQKSLERALE